VVFNKYFVEKKEISSAILTAFIFVIIGATLAYYNGLRQLPLISTIITFSFLITTYCLLSVEDITNWLQQTIFSNPSNLWLLAVFFLLTYCVYSFGNNSFTLVGLGKLLLFLFFPILIIFIRSRQEISKKIYWYEFLAILLIWLPFDLRLLNGIWIGKVVYAFNVLVAFNLALVLFLVCRGVEDIGYSFRVKKETFYHSITNFLFFAPIAIPIGLVTNFMVFLPQHHNIVPIFLTSLGIFLFTALPEELLFRGLIQNLLKKKLSNKNLALLIASILFGLAHLNNASYPKNLTYCFLATIAGLFYGRAYFATNSILTSAITHALVDITWHELFK
jgi:membrane protease YdiL (CAAX protease family)